MHFAWVTNLLLEAADKQQEHLHLPEIFQEIKTDGISQLSMCMHTHTVGSHLPKDLSLKLLEKLNIRLSFMTY